VLSAPWSTPSQPVDALSGDERSKVIRQSVLHGHYEQIVDRESAYEKLKARQGGSGGEAPVAAPQAVAAVDQTGRPEGRPRSPVEQVVGLGDERARRGDQIGRQIVRGCWAPCSADLDVGSRPLKPAHPPSGGTAALEDSGTQPQAGCSLRRRRRNRNGPKTRSHGAIRRSGSPPFFGSSLAPV